MAKDERAWFSLAGPIIGVLAVLAGLAILILRRDEGQALSWLFIGAVIAGTTGSGRQYRCWPRKGGVRAKTQ